MEGLRARPSAENENGLNFSATGAAFFFWHYNQALSVRLFYDWSAAHISVLAIASEKKRHPSSWV